MEECQQLDRSNFSTLDSITHIWCKLGLPNELLTSLNLHEDKDFYTSSLKVGHLAHASIALSALAAALVWSTRTGETIPTVSIGKEHACAEFISERLYTVNGKQLDSSLNTIGGLHKTADGYVRMHDGFPHHRNNAMKILGLEEGANRGEVAEKMLQWKKSELESVAFQKGAVIVALRSFEEWDALPQAEAVADFPIQLRKLGHSNPSSLRPGLWDFCLQGLRVVDMSRVIAAPVTGRTLAAHGADVLWITSPSLPSLPSLDTDTARGKRTVHLDIENPAEKAQLLELLRTADVFLSSYRPGSLAVQGFSAEELAKLNPNLVIGTLTAWGEEGPWAKNRGFDSLVQAASGINVAEAEWYNEGEPSRVLPCQALDHASGYLLATGIIAALYKRAVHGRSYEVHVSLAGTMKYLRSLGQDSAERPLGEEGSAEHEDLEKYMETRDSGFGQLKAITHSASISGVGVGYRIMPKPLGSDPSGWD